VMTRNGTGRYLQTLAAAAGLLLAGWATVGCQGSDAKLAKRIARDLAAASPLAAPDDAAAHRLSAEKLARLESLREAMAEPFLWGGQRPGRGYKPEDSHLTTMSPLVWRQMYLSLFMFTGEHQIEQADGYTVLHLPGQFRNQLDPGAYPYPFWHAKKKWENYERAAKVILVLDQGKIVAGFRSAQEVDGRPQVTHHWDGLWTWQDASGAAMPYVTLFRSLFSETNPHVAELETTYRALEEVAREQRCMHCHSPDNIGRANPLALLNYPNQALSTRHELVHELQENTMPPANEEEGHPAGIADAAARKRLLELARAFAKAGDRALAHEGEPQRTGS
jgi:hypothetical protein